MWARDHYAGQQEMSEWVSEGKKVYYPKQAQNCCMSEQPRQLASSGYEAVMWYITHIPQNKKLCTLFAPSVKDTW